MSERSKYGSASGLPIRNPRKIPAGPLTSAIRIQSGCSTKVESSSSISRNQVGLPKNRLGNRTKKPILTDVRQNQITSKSFLNPIKKEIEVSKSTPNLSQLTLSARPKVNSGLSVADNLQKIKSWESMAKTGKVSLETSKVQTPSRIPTKSFVPTKLKSSNEPFAKSKKIEVAKKAPLPKTLTTKSMDNKRKFGCVEGFTERGKQKAPDRSGLSPSTDCPYQLSVNNRTEECKKIIKKIMLDKKNPVDSGEKKRSSAEFEDSIGTFSSDEMADMLFTDSFKAMDSTKILCETDKSSKRNSSEFDDSIGSFFSDQMVLTMSKSNEFLNLAGSKQSFFNDNPLGLSMSEDIENLTPGLSNLSNAMERTPSAEELPMESEPDVSLPEPETIICDRSASPTEEVPQESTSSRTPNAPVSIITSITSIMSLDTGYQGDGELSRPESRNTENDSKLLKLSIAENGIPVKSINFDDGKTMTDSDFFTESDADIHDDLSAAAAEIGSGKGDRKAQVIDGTLYGGAHIQTHFGNNNITGYDHNSTVMNVQSNRSTNATNNANEDMESSGIYSDLEKKPEELWVKEKEPVSCMDMITEQIKTIQSLALAVADRKLKEAAAAAEGIVKSSSGESSNTVRENGSPVPVPRSPDVPPSEKSPSEDSEQPHKRVKVPARTVSTKVKPNAIETTKEGQIRTKTLKKGKWDAVMDKIAQGKEENKYLPSKFRDVKSKVFQNLGPSVVSNNRRNVAESKMSAKVSPNSQLKSRSRRNTRIRSSESSLVSPKSKQSRTTASPNSSQRSSLSDISLSVNLHQKTAIRGSKKRDSISPLQSNESTNSTNTPTRKLNNDASITRNNKGTIPCRNSDLQNGNVLRSPSGTVLDTMKTPTLRKAPTPRRGDTVGPTLHRTASVPFKDSNHNGIVSKSGSAVIINNNTNSQNNNNNHNVKSIQSKSLKPATRVSNPVQMKNGCLLAAAKEANKALLKQLKHNGRAFESLAILFSYCANDLDAFSTPHLKQKLEIEKSKVVQAQLDIEELQSRLIRVREELNDKELVITELSNDKISLGEKTEHYERLVEELKNKLQAVTEQKREAESELLKECENIRCLRRELSNRSDKFETEKDDLVCSLTEAKRENGILKSANREIKEEYDKCLLENQRLVELISKRQNEMARMGKENRENEEVTRSRGKSNGNLNDCSPERIPTSPVSREKSFRSFQANASPSPINPKCLESEVESLRQVLALKTDEVTELRRQELSLRENADRVPKLLSTITMLEGKVEDLQSQLSSQTETVRDLFKSNEHLEDELKSANIQKTRLTHKNEELQYKLKQYAEAMKQLATQKNLSEKSLKTEISPIKTNYKRSDSSCLDDSVKSQMKAVVEKSDSVSYMLEMTEDSSEIVTNIIRRAESLRSSNRDQVTSKKRRPKGSSVSSTDTPTPKRNFSMEEDFGPDIMSTPYHNSSEYEFERRASPGKTSGSPKYPNKKTVKLSSNDFSTDSIEVTNEGDCEIIEITKNFDRRDKNGEMTTSTSSTGSSSASNESHFDIESDVFAQVEEDEDDENVARRDSDDLEDETTTENSEGPDSRSTIVRTYRRETESLRPVQRPVYKDLDSPRRENHPGNGYRDDEEEVQNGRGRQVAEMNGEKGQNSYLAKSKNCLGIPKISGGESMIGLSSDDEDIEKIQKIYNK